MNEFIHDMMDQKGAPILVGFFASLFLTETIFSLRSRRNSRTQRIITNGIVAIPGLIGLRLLLLPAMVYISYKNQDWRIGINYLYNWTPWLEGAMAFLLLDYTNYLWHFLNHKVPLLWRFHLFHHTDIDLDVTTAVRFHFGELITSVFFRGFTVFIIGAPPSMVLVYEVAFELATQFHHSNLKLPFLIERALNRVIVTPRMHGIHHSIIRREADSNYSVIFSFWDRLHGTVNLHIHQHEITIGVPVYDDPSELTIGYLLNLPFTKIRKWSANEAARGSESRSDLLD
ncbi:MAG: sterol desaturase family protein [Bacteroidota bacterium]